MREQHGRQRRKLPAPRGSRGGGRRRGRRQLGDRDSGHGREGTRRSSGREGRRRRVDGHRLQCSYSTLVRGHALAAAKAAAARCLLAVGARGGARDWGARVSFFGQSAVLGAIKAHRARDGVEHRRVLEELAGCLQASRKDDRLSH